MARRLRLHVAGGFYHVTLRGNHRQAIFFAEADRELLARVVGHATGQLGARIHAYCWMTNHLHLLVQVADAPLGRLMLRIASQYARRVQASMATTGHLFERRHHAVLVDADAYLLTLIRYIHRNPVRAGLVVDPADYPWCSHGAYLGRQAPAWLTTDFALQLLGGGGAEAMARYRRFMDTATDDAWGKGALAPQADQPGILGSEDFIASLRPVPLRPRQPMSLDTLLHECASRFDVPLQALDSPSRSHRLGAARAWLGHQVVAQGIASVSALARRLGRTEAAIRQAMVRHPLDPG